MATAAPAKRAGSTSRHESVRLVVEADFADPQAAMTMQAPSRCSASTCVHTCVLVVLPWPSWPVAELATWGNGEASYPGSQVPAGLGHTDLHNRLVPPGDRRRVKEYQ